MIPMLAVIKATIALSASFHTVVPGDTLYAIGQADHGATWQEVWSVNRWIEDPNLIYPGERVRLPSPDTPDAQPDPPIVVSAYAGHLGCGGLEALWTEAGGPRYDAVLAASIAMAESSGGQYATGPYGERGYWQINPDHGALSTYDAYGNARAAVIISNYGRDFTPWTTYTHGLYIGRC